MIILGIDPGLSGALAFLDTKTGMIAVEDMPTVTVMRNRKEKREVSAQLVAAIVVKRHVEAAFLEKVNAMAGQGVSSVFSFGRSAGIIEGVLAAFDIPTTLVTPQAWQKAMNVRDGKDGSRERAMQLFPASAELFQRKKDDGRSDASLIAKYGATQGEHP
jgi:crossover junction endodeoxyribonuclease RuvC